MGKWLFMPLMEFLIRRNGLKWIIYLINQKWKIFKEQSKKRREPGNSFKANSRTTDSNREFRK